MPVQQPLDGAAPHHKSSRGVSLYSRHVNRPFGGLLARWAHRAGLSANKVTAVSAVVTALGILLLAVPAPSVLTGVVAAALLVLGFAFDSADGQVARLSGTGSLAGEWFDHTVDAGKMVALHAGVLIGLYRFDDGHPSWLLAPLGFQFVAVVTFSGLTTVTLLKTLRPRNRPEAMPRTARSVLLLPADYGVLCWTFLLWGLTDVFKVAYLGLLVLNTILLGALLAKWFLELRRIDQDISG